MNQIRALLIIHTLFMLFSAQVQAGYGPSAIALGTESSAMAGADCNPPQKANHSKVETLAHYAQGGFT